MYVSIFSDQFSNCIKRYKNNILIILNQLLKFPRFKIFLNQEEEF